MLEKKVQRKCIRFVEKMKKKHNLIVLLCFDTSSNKQAYVIRDMDNCYRLHMNLSVIREVYEKMQNRHHLNVSYISYVYIVLMHELGHCTMPKKEALHLNELAERIEKLLETKNLGAFKEEVEHFINKREKEEQRAWEWAKEHLPPSVAATSVVSDIISIFLPTTRYWLTRWKEENISEIVKSFFNNDNTFS